MALLEVQNIHSYYGNLEALHGVSLRVEEGEIVSLIGANGAGKTTTLRSLCNLIRPRQGSIIYAGQDIRGIAVHELVSVGMVMVPEGRGIFSKLTVQENLQMGAFQCRDSTVMQQTQAYVEDIFPRLRERLSQLAGTLSGGEQQMLAIARALMARPKMLLLDEPSMGLAPLLVSQIFDTLSNINANGTTILLVEQNAKRALELSHRGYVLETGTIALEGTSEELIANPKVIEAYLGG